MCFMLGPFCGVGLKALSRLVITMLVKRERERERERAVYQFICFNCDVSVCPVSLP